MQPCPWVFEVTDVEHHHFKATGVQLQNLDCPVSSVVDQWQSWHEARKRGERFQWMEGDIQIFLSNFLLFRKHCSMKQSGIWDRTRNICQPGSSYSKYASYSRHPSGASFLDAVKKC